MARPRQRTKDRLLAAASALFAERGFHGTTIRDIAERAKVNVAAGNYHYGSKKALYLEVLRAEFAKIRAELRRRGASVTREELARLKRAELEELLRRRARTMLDLMIGPPPGRHATLMLREMADPSEALPVIVEEFVKPMIDEGSAIVAQLAPGLDRRMVERCVLSLMGQALFYRSTMPALLHMWELPAYPAGLASRLADHVTEFTLGGLERLAANKERRRAG